MSKGGQSVSAIIRMVAKRSFEQICVGDKGMVSKTITEADVANFAGMTGDFNPLHVNQEYAKSSRFGQRVVHGLLTASFLSTLIGMCLPGEDALYLSQTVKFVKPVFIGDTITVVGEVTAKNEARRRMTIDTKITKQTGELVVEGQAEVLMML